MHTPVDSPVQCLWLSQHAVVVGRRRVEDEGRIKEEDNRGKRAEKMKEYRIKEAEEEKRIGKSRYER